MGLRFVKRACLAAVIPIRACVFLGSLWGLLVLVGVILAPRPQAPREAPARPARRLVQREGGAAICGLLRRALCAELVSARGLPSPPRCSLPALSTTGGRGMQR